VRTDDPFGRTDDPFVRTDDPFVRTDDPFGRTDDPFGRTDDPFVRTDGPFGRTDDPFVRTDDPFVRTDDPFVRTDDPFVRTDDPFGRTDDPFVRTDDPFVRTDDPFVRTDDRFGRTGDPFASPSLFGKSRAARRPGSVGSKRVRAAVMGSVLHPTGRLVVSDISDTGAVAGAVPRFARLDDPPHRHRDARGGPGHVKQGGQSEAPFHPGHAFPVHSAAPGHFALREVLLIPQPDQFAVNCLADLQADFMGFLRIHLINFLSRLV
jgi:hypothetical protein